MQKRWLARSKFILIASVMGILLLSGTQKAVGLSIADPLAVLSGNSADDMPAGQTVCRGAQRTNLGLADGVDDKEEMVFLVLLYSAKYKVDACQLVRIVECESSYNPEARNKDSGALGAAQFLESTWMRTTPFGQKYGLKAALHPAVNLEAAAWMLSQGRSSEWLCFS